jgi:hypothetical protein
MEARVPRPATAAVIISLENSTSFRAMRIPGDGDQRSELILTLRNATAAVFCRRDLAHSSFGGRRIARLPPAVKAIFKASRMMVCVRSCLQAHDGEN